MAETFLELKDIHKSFGGVQALKGVDLTIRCGEIHCLAGENGSGKSTLIKVISGAHEPTKGEIYIEGEGILHLNPIIAIEHGIQVIYQDFAIFPNLTVAENIAMNRAVSTGAKLMNWKGARELALEAMEQIGAKMDPDVLVENLSVANRQMVAICRTIINDAKLLILDEPTNGLDPTQIRHVREMLIGLKDRQTVLLIDHGQPQPVERYRRLDKGMGADDDLNRAVGQTSHDSRAFGGRRATRQQGHADPQWLQQPAQTAVMLLSQDFGRGHQGGLRSVGSSHNHRRGGHSRLARTNIPLQQAVHRAGLGQVGANLLYDALLCASQPEG